ncbi:hypothetical protein CspHIS471_0502110 [Cutaneotrichosporon sp. HIS471]|nr:hypothetical protein CspHIS471_0502110 [Cutaneotrichosporon sp. HIS471]
MDRSTSTQYSTKVAAIGGALSTPGTTTVHVWVTRGSSMYLPGGSSDSWSLGAQPSSDRGLISHETHKSHLIGAIVGSVVGGITLTLIVALIFWRRRRKITLERDFYIDGESEGEHRIEPFPPATILPKSDDPPPLVVLPSSENNSTLSPKSASSPSFDPPVAGPSVSPSFSSSPQAPNSEKPSEPIPGAVEHDKPSEPIPAAVEHDKPSEPQPVEVEHAIDAGAAPTKEVLPPMYDPSWSGARQPVDSKSG